MFSVNVWNSRLKCCHHTPTRGDCTQTWSFENCVSGTCFQANCPSCHCYSVYHVLQLDVSRCNVLTWRQHFEHIDVSLSNVLMCLGAMCRARKVFFHTDAAQAVGKIPLDVNRFNIDLMSISGHKIYGPKGLYLYVWRVSLEVHLV